MIWHLSFLSEASVLKAATAPSQMPLEMIAVVCSWVVIILRGSSFFPKVFLSNVNSCAGWK